MPKLVFHAFFGEFSGDSPEEIMRQLYEHSRKGIGPDLTLRRWWDYQRAVWKLREGKDLPASPDEPGAAGALVACLVDVGGLVEGPKPG